MSKEKIKNMQAEDSICFGIPSILEYFTTPKGNPGAANPLLAGMGKPAPKMSATMDGSLNPRNRESLKGGDSMLLRSLKDMIGYDLVGADGDIGKVEDFYFDDKKWYIRYLVNKSGFWLFSRQVLISPSSFEKPDWNNRQFSVSLTKHQIENSPPIEAKEPVSKEKEKKLTDYFNWPVYWGGMGPNMGTGMGTTSGVGVAGMGVPGPIPVQPANREIAQDEKASDEGLRSIDEVTGYKISTLDGKLGDVDDFIVDDESWAIRYMVVDTKKILDGKKVLVAPEWIKWVSWHDKEVSVNMDKEAIKTCPENDSSVPISEEYEDMIHGHYDFKNQWNG